jgi:hypothetical protein
MNFVIQILAKPDTRRMVIDEKPPIEKYKTPLTDRFSSIEDAVATAKTLYSASKWRVVDESGNVVASKESIAGRRRNGNRKTRSKRMNKRYTKRR